MEEARQYSAVTDADIPVMQVRVSPRLRDLLARRRIYSQQRRIAVAGRRMAGDAGRDQHRALYHLLWRCRAAARHGRLFLRARATRTVGDDRPLSFDRRWRADPGRRSPAIAGLLPLASRTATRSAPVSTLSFRTPAARWSVIRPISSARPLTSVTMSGSPRMPLIRRGVVIGDGAVIAAGAIVTPRRTGLRDRRRRTRQNHQDALRRRAGGAHDRGEIGGEYGPDVDNAPTSATRRACSTIWRGRLRMARSRYN